MMRGKRNRSYAEQPKSKNHVHCSFFIGRVRSWQAIRPKQWLDWLVPNPLLFMKFIRKGRYKSKGEGPVSWGATPNPNTTTLWQRWRRIWETPPSISTKEWRAGKQAPDQKNKPRQQWASSTTNKWIYRSSITRWLTCITMFASCKATHDPFIFLFFTQKKYRNLIKDWLIEDAYHQY